MKSSDPEPVQVTLLRWPQDEGRRAMLREGNQARLLLVEPGAPAPDVVDAIEDWIRMPADDADVRARVEALEHRGRSTPRPRPALDDDGLLRFRDGWVPLGPVEARLVGALLERYGGVVGRHTLTRAGWLDEVPSRNALDVKMFRLRRRLVPLGLSIRTVRSRGYLLEAETP